MGIAHIGEQFLPLGKKHQIQIIRMGMSISPRKMQMHLHLMFALSPPQPRMPHARQQCRMRLFKRFDIGINPSAIPICPSIVHGNPTPIGISANIQKPICLFHNINIALQIQVVVSHAIIRHIIQWIGIPFQRVKYHLHTRHCHPVVPQTAFMPKPVRIKLALKQPDTATNRFMHQFWIAQNAAHHRIPAIDMGTRIGIENPVKSILPNGPAKKIVLNPLFHIYPNRIGQSLQFTTRINRIISHSQIGRHFIVPPPPPLAPIIWIGRFKHKAFLFVWSIITHQKTRIIPRECIQNQRRTPRIYRITRRLIQLSEYFSDCRKIHTRLSPRFCPEMIPKSRLIFPKWIRHRLTHRIDDRQHLIIGILFIGKHHLTKATFHAMRIPN